MKKIILTTLVATAIGAAALAANAGPRPAVAADAGVQFEPQGYGDAFCRRLNDACDRGDANACRLYYQGCMD